MDISNNQNFIQNHNINKNKDKNILLINEKNKNTNKIRLNINQSHNKSLNRFIQENYSKTNYYSIHNKSPKMKKTNLMDPINELTLDSLVQENNLLKKEIEIVKSNLIISNEKEQLHKNTIQKINKINKEKEISFKNSINLIEEYKKREFEFQKKIKEMEIEYNKKEEELNNKLSLFKKELFNKNKIINDLNNKINILNEKIINLKNIIKEKNDIIFYYTYNKNEDKNFLSKRSNTPTMASCKSSSNKIGLRKELKRFPDKSLNAKLDKSFKNYQKIKPLNNEEYKLYLNIKSNNDNNQNEDILSIIRKNFYYKKRIASKNKGNQNSLKIHSVTKNYSNKNINRKSFNYSMSNNPNIINDQSFNMSNYKINKNNKNTIYFNRNINRDLVKNFRNITDRNTNEIVNKNNTIQEIYIDKKKNIFISPEIQNSERKEKRKNIIEFNNYSLILNDIGKNNPNKLLNINDDLINSQNYKDKNNNTFFDNIFSNNNLKPKNMKGIIAKKNKIIEIKK